MNGAEAKIVIDGQLLTEAEAMATRVAVSSMLLRLNEEGALGTDAHGEEMRRLYRKHLSSVQVLLVPT